MPIDYRRTGLGRRDYRMVGMVRDETIIPMVSPYTSGSAISAAAQGVVNISISFKVKSTQQPVQFSFGFRR